MSLPVAVVGPAVIAASQLAVLAPAFAELGGAMEATVGERRRRAVGVEKQHELFAEQGKRLWAARERVESLGRIPETAQDFLAGCQHGVGSEFTSPPAC